MCLLHCYGLLRYSQKQCLFRLSLDALFTTFNDLFRLVKKTITESQHRAYHLVRGDIIFVSLYKAIIAL